MSLFEQGFECGDFGNSCAEEDDAWTGTENTPTVQSSEKHQGTYAESAVTTGTAWAKTVCYKTISGESTLFIRAYVYFTNLPAANGDFVLALATHWWQDYGWWAGIKRINPNNHQWSCISNGGGGSSYDSGSDIGDVTGSWICMELKVVTSETVGEVRLWIDGVEVITETGLDTGTTDADMISTGAFCWDSTQVTTHYVDCVVADTSYIGPKAVDGVAPVGNMTIMAQAAGII